MNAFLQKHMDGPMNYQTARIGLEMIGYYITDNNIDDMKRDDIAYGNVSFIDNVFKTKVGLERPHSGFVPEAFRKFAPSFNIVHVDEGRKMTGRFIKPSPKFQKWFPGFVMNPDTPAVTMMNLAGFDGDVIVQDAVQYVSEWRLFVAEGKLLAAQHYKGNFRIAPSWMLIDTVIETAGNVRGRAWSFDVGITSTDTSFVIEVHDLFSLGTYGIRPGVFACMLELAWEDVWKLKGKPK